MQHAQEHPPVREPSAPSGDAALTTALARTRAHLWRAGRAPIAAWAAAAFLGMWIVLAMLDALFASADATRIALVIAIAPIVAATVAILVVRVRRATEPAALAIRLDRITTPVVRTGVGLLDHRASPRANALTEGLTALALTQAATATSDADVAALVPRASTRRPIRLLTLGVILYVGIAVVAPRLVGTELLRLIDPRGDHPPYSRLIFTVEPASTDVPFGHALDIAATVAGGTPDDVQLVSRSMRDGSERSIPMLRGNDSMWHATLASVREPLECFVRAGDARSKRVAIHVRTLPQIESVQVKLTPPAYTCRPSSIGPLPADGIHVLAGTQVELRVTSNRPLVGGLIDGVNRLPILASPDDPTSVSGAFVADAAGWIRVDLIDVDRQHSERPLTIPIAIDADAPPTVHLVLPPPISYATPDAVVDARVEAGDDIGLAGLSLERSLSDLPPSPLRFELSDSPREASGRTTLALGPLGLKAGDTIRLSARAADAFPGNGHLVSSNDAVIHIVTPAELDALLLKRDGPAALVGRYATAGRIATEAMGTEVPTTRTASSLAANANAAAERIDAAAARPLPLSLDAVMTPKLTALADALRSAARVAARPSDPAAAIASARATLASATERFRRETIAPLDRLTAILPIAIEARRLRSLADAERALADRVREATTQPVAADGHHLADEQAALRRQFEASLDRIEAAARSLPEASDASVSRTAAIAFAAIARGGDASPSMRVAEERLASEELSAAVEPCATAATAIEQLCSKAPPVDAAIDGAFPNDPATAAAAKASIDPLAALSPAAASGGNSPARLDEIGLYGADLPAGPAAATAGGGGPPGPHAATIDRAADPSAAVAKFRQEWHYDASGAADVPVPPAYRERTDAYFRRVVDELQGGGR